MPQANRKGNAIPELVELPSPVFQYMREELANPHPLAHIISSLPLESGQVQVFATKDTPVENLLRLRDNPFLSDDDLRASWQSFKRFAADYLRLGDSRVFLMGNPDITRDFLLQRLQRGPFVSAVNGQVGASAGSTLVSI